MLWLFAMIDDPDDRAFFTELYQEHRRMLYLVARRYVLSEQDIMDVVQDSLVCLMEKIAKLRQMEPDGRTGYMVATVRNTAFNRAKREAYRRDKTAPLDPSLPEPCDRVEDLIALMDDRARLLDVWSRMTEEDRFLFEAKFVRELSNREIAQVLDCKPDSIRMKLTRARKRLLSLEREVQEQ